MALAILFALSSLSAIASSERDLSPDGSSSSKPEIVKWVGFVKGDPLYHTTNHDHSLQFVLQSDGDSFDIVDSPELVKLHHETEKNFLAEIEAEKTSRFLFWGGNLIVKKFKILKELETVAHTEPVRRRSFEHGR